MSPDRAVRSNGDSLPSAAMHQTPQQEGRALPDMDTPTTRPREEQGELFRSWAAPGMELLTLIVEAVDAVDAGTLVVPTEQEEVLGVLDLIGQQQADGLQRLLAPVYVVPQEEVVALWREAPVFKQPQKVVVLAVDITCDPGNQVSTGAGSLLEPRARVGLKIRRIQGRLQETKGPGQESHRRS